MAIHLTHQHVPQSKPIYLCNEQTLAELPLTDEARAWVAANNFTPEEGNFLTLPDNTGNVAGAIIGMGTGKNPFSIGVMEKALTSGQWYLVDFSGKISGDLLYLAALMGAYHFDSYKQKSETSSKQIELFIPDYFDKEDILRQARAVTLARDLINMPANDMGPESLEGAVRQLAVEFQAEIDVVQGEDLLAQNFPLIHAVGRAGGQEPRLLDLRWGEPNAPKVTLVGKGVCFDTGGLDIKGASGMVLMKKDMGGAANVIALAMMVMDAGLPVRLRLLIPAVENSISANAMRPGDIIPSRKGLSVEIGNTDAEGRLVLADSLSLAAEEAPDLLIDMATLTGAARVGMGPDLPPFYSDDSALVEEIEHFSRERYDPLWRLPLWQPYMKNLSSPFADINNVTNDGFAGSITAALFLNRFVDGAKAHAHFDIYGWTPTARPGFPKGGEAQGIRALYALLRARFSK